ncbi:MAG TPA: chemotaxis response regulator protein-glutamate methylesterase [Gallionellaceae bacterium]|nr:chemotaxis response regulator protein-glutamate methylesterase [Gallionellaceae bacterium]
MNHLGPNAQSPIRVLLVDDSLLTLAILKRMLSAAPEIQVVGTATNGQEALDIIPALQPDVICTDLHMPVMDGLELTKAVMEKFPRPILVLSVSVQKGQASTIFKLLEAGAIDVMAKPLGEVGMDYGLDARELIGKIKILAGVVVIRKRRKEPYAPASGNHLPPIEGGPLRIIGIGASTGGPQAFQEILTHLPGNLPVPVICVQHISEEFMQGLVDWLTPQCKLKIVSAETGIEPQPGTVYFPRGGSHLIVDNLGRLECTNAPIYEGHRPSVSITFKSLAQHYGREVVGVLLTGMGRDGVDGMLAIARAGGTTIAQDEESSIVFGMPKEAIAASAARYVLPLPKIAPALLKLLNPSTDTGVP